MQDQEYRVEVTTLSNDTTRRRQVIAVASGVLLSLALAIGLATTSQASEPSPAGGDPVVTQQAAPAATDCPGDGPDDDGAAAPASEV
jgi:hypothetical protein